MSGSLVSVVYPFSARSRKSLFLVRRIPKMTMDDQYPRLVVESLLARKRLAQTFASEAASEFSPVNHLLCGEHERGPSKQRRSSNFHLPYCWNPLLSISLIERRLGLRQ
jgi:hypothetical protein